MKKLLTVLLSIIMTVSVLGGTTLTSVSAAETIEISNVADLMYIADSPDANFYLLNDIDAEDFTWTSVPSFSGNFYGNGYSVSINGAPLFGTIESGATVQDLSVWGTSVSGETNVGVIAGTIKGTVRNCYAMGYASAASVVGGLAGLIDGGTVSDCYASVTVSGSTGTLGGFAGKAENADISRCYSTSTVSGSTVETGAFIGNNSSSQITNCYYGSDNSSQFLGVGMGSDTVTGLSSAQMNSTGSFAGFDFTNTWNIIEGVTRPRLISINGQGTQQSPYRIHNVTDFSELLSAGCGAANAGKYYRLDNDIEGDLTTIGSNDNRFTGIFDGNNHVIRSNDNALFGAVETGAVVRNVVFYGGSRYSGDIFGFAAAINYGTIENCHVYGAEISGSKDLGGIAGENINGTVSRCSVVNPSISGSQTGIAGIVGYNSFGTISECVVRDGRVNGSQNSVGGIVGDNTGGLVENCMVWNTSVRAASEVGGIAGRLYNGTLRNCYANQATTATENVGAIAGNIIEDGLIQNCYYNSEKTAVAVGSTGDTTGALTSGGTKSTSSFSGFDFSTVWTIDSDGDMTVAAISGRGTKENPYIIRSGYDWTNAGDGISAAGERNYYALNNTAYGVSAIDSFSGSLDGRGHIMRGGTLTNNLTSSGYIGNVVVFGGRAAQSVNGGKIEYTTTLSAPYSDGGFAGTLTGGSVSNSAAVGGSLTSDSATGGFAAQVSGGTVTNCYVRNMSVGGNGFSGGFVGNNSGGRISNCYVYGGEVSSSNTVGGFAGRNDNGGVIENCYTNTAVAASGTYSGAFVGMNYATIQNVFADNSAVASFAALDEGTSSNVSLSSDGATMQSAFIKTASTNLTVNDTTVYTPTNQPTTQTGLTDISGHWAEATIRNLVEKGVVNGYEDNTFRPEDNVTKGEYIKLLMTATGSGTSSNFTNYQDVNASWAREFVSRAVELGICDNVNTSATIFGVDEPITRAQAAALMGRLLAPDVTGTPAFTDSADIPDWAANPIYASVQLGLLAGNDDGTFRPINNLTRAESATIIERIMLSLIHI